MKKDDAVQFCNFANKFAFFNGRFGILKSEQDDGKWRVMVNNGKDRLVSTSNMKVVKIDLDEKLKNPYCMVWPNSTIHKIDFTCTENLKIQKISKLLDCEAPKFLKLNSDKVKIPGTTDTHELECIVWYNPEDKSSKINKIFSDGSEEMIHGCCVVDFSSKYVFLEKCIPSVKNVIFSKQFEKKEDLERLILMPSLTLGNMISTINGESAQKFNLVESYEINYHDVAGNLNSINLK